ncbi:MAG: hypothetical protein U1E62_13035 [Alsobacter sp.]
MTSAFSNQTSAQQASTMTSTCEDAAPGAIAPPESRATPAKPRRRRVLDRLWAAAELQIEEIEARMKSLCGEGADIEREARTLAVLARVVRELTAPKPRASSRKPAEQRTGALRGAGARGRGFPAISRTEVGEGENAGPVRNLDQLRDELARHLQRLQDEAAAARAAGEAQ